MEPGSPKAAVVIVHGAWGLAELYDNVIARLKSNGFDAVCPPLPTCNNARPPSATRQDDVTTIQDAVRKFIDRGLVVFILMHSYGGIIGSEAALEDLSVQHRSKQGLSGGIARLVFMSAFIILPGENVVQAQGFGAESDTHAKEANSEDMEVEYHDDGTCRLLSAWKTSFNGLYPEEGRALNARLPVFPVEAAMAPVTRAPWANIPTTFVHGMLDRSILPPVQERMIRRAVDAKGVADLLEMHVDTDHSPQLTSPEKMVQVIKEVWKIHHSEH